jgi:hypothetical protein
MGCTTSPIKVLPLMKIFLIFLVFQRTITIQIYERDFKKPNFLTSNFY